MPPLRAWPGRALRPLGKRDEEDALQVVRLDVLRFNGDRHELHEALAGETQGDGNLTLNDTKLKAICDPVGISSRTAYVWRMKVYSSALRIQERSVLSGTVWIDEKLIPVNKSGELRLPNGKKPRGMSRNQVVVACAVDSGWKRVAVVAGRGHITSAQCVRAYGPHIAVGSTVVHDGTFSHDRLISSLGARSVVYKSVTREAHSGLQPVNSFIAEIEPMRVHGHVDGLPAALCGVDRVQVFGQRAENRRDRRRTGAHLLPD